MKIIFLALTFLLATCLPGQAQDLKNNSGNEPKSNFEVTINGKKIKITEDEAFVIDTVLVKPTISIKLSPLKKFDNASISFDYPKHLSFAFEQDYGFKNWTLSGNDLTVMIFEMDVKTTLSSITDEMVKKFKKKNCVTEDFEKELGNVKCIGKSLLVTMAGQKLLLDCYEIVLNDFKSRFIYFQDVFTDGQHSAEYQEWFSVINSSINYTVNN
jgi:hypothetical protein